VSLFVSQKSNKQEFESISFDKWVQQYKLANGTANASFENSSDWTQKDCDNIGKELKRHI
jgi:hypothetical protein